MAQATADQLYLASAITASDTLGSQLQTARGALRSALHGFSESVRAAEHGARFAYNRASVNYARDVDTTIEEATFAFETASIGASTARNIQRNTLFGTAMRGLTTAEGDTLRSRSTARRTHATWLAEAYTTAAQDGAFFEIANHPGDVSALAQLQSQFMMGNAVPIDEALLNDLDPDDPTNPAVAPPTVSPGEAQATWGTAVSAADTALNTAHHSAEDARITAVTGVRDTLGLGMATSDAGWDSTMSTAGAALGTAIDGIPEFDWQHVRDFVGTVANARKAAELGALTAQAGYLNTYYSSLGSFQTGMAAASATRATTQAQATADYFVNTAVQEANAAEALAASTGSASDQALAIAARARADAFAAFATTYVSYLTTATQTAATTAVAETATANAASLATVTTDIVTATGEINTFYIQQITDAATPPPVDNDANDDGIPDAPTRSATEVMSSYVEGVRAQRAIDQAGVQSSFSDLVDRRAPVTTSTIEYMPGQYPITYTEMSGPYNPTATQTLPVTGPISSGENVAHFADETLERPVLLNLRNCLEAPTDSWGPTLDFSKALEEALGTKKPSPPLTPAQQKELEDQLAAIKEFMEKPQPESPERDSISTFHVTIVIPTDFDDSWPDRFIEFPPGTNWSVIKTALKANHGSYMRIGDIASIVGVPPELVPFIRNTGAVVAATKPDLGAEFRAAQEAYESTIFWGQVQTMGGVASTVGAGLFLASNPAGWLTIIVGGGGLLLGVDQTQAGARQAITGEVTHTFTNETLVKYGLTREQANWVEFGIGLGLSIGELAIIAKAAATREAAELAVRKLAEQQSKSADEVAKLSKEVAENLEEEIAQEPNRIYSARELLRRAEETGPFHNFPESFNAEIFKGTRTVVSDTYVVYTRPGTIRFPSKPIFNSAGRRIGEGPSRIISGVFEIGVRPSLSGRTEVIIHRFFKPGLVTK